VIHIAIGLVVLSITVSVLVLVSIVVPGAPVVDGVFVTDTCVAMALSSVLLWYVRRHRL